ncbi:hypothetical protein C1X65_19965 [Pseudomonas sp. FW305-70]|nr:hypothetical protein C1X65_19965 [Pseudomonas sp. FW305-70]
MVVNDYAGQLDDRGALESIASKLAPTVSRGFQGSTWAISCGIDSGRLAKRCASTAQTIS